MNNCRYRLQHKEPYTMPNILGNHSMPVKTYRWVDIAASDSREALQEMVKNNKEYRVEDTRPYQKAGIDESGEA